MQYLVLVLVGALTGVLGGMLGIGGSIIMIPAMVTLLARLSQNEGWVRLNPEDSGTNGP